MPSDKIKRLNTWLRKTLVITEKTTLPGTINGEVRPILDAMGWDLLQLTEHVNAVVPGPTLFARLPIVPADEAHLFLCCGARHDDPANQRIIGINYRDPAGAEAPVQSGITLQPEQNVAVSRPVLVLAGARLVAVSADSVIIGTNLTILGQFIRLNIGEYIPGSPYG